MIIKKEMPKKKENYWKCPFCWKKIDKFEGWEKFANIKEYTPSVQAGLFKAKDKYKDNEFFNHLECWDGARRMYCKFGYCKEHGLTFKHRTEYYRHRKKAHHIEPEIDDDMVDKKKLVKNFCNKLDKLYGQGYRAEDLEWSLDVRSESPVDFSTDSESENIKMNIEI